MIWLRASTKYPLTMVERAQRMYLRHTNILTNFIKVSVDAGNFCLSRSRPLIASLRSSSFHISESGTRKNVWKTRNDCRVENGIYQKRPLYWRWRVADHPGNKIAMTAYRGYCLSDGASLLDILILKNDEVPLKLQVWRPSKWLLMTPTEQSGK